MARWHTPKTVTLQIACQCGPRVPTCPPAFTLVELLTVLAILAILMGLLVAFYRPSQEQRKVFECQNRLQVLHRALRLYALDWDGFPASPYDVLNSPADARVGGLLALLPTVTANQQGLVSVGGYLRSQNVLVCPADPNPLANMPYSSYQGCDTDQGFVPAPPPASINQAQSCPNGGVPTYAITRFPVGNPCHPANPNFLSQCTDTNKFRQLGVSNTKPYFPNPTFPADDTVVTWCVHHRFVRGTTTPNYTKGGNPADVVLYWDGSVRLQMMRAPAYNWLRRPDEP